jgi:hypothetical protein
VTLSAGRRHGSARPRLLRCIDFHTSSVALLLLRHVGSYTFQHHSLCDYIGALNDADLAALAAHVQR